MRELAAALIAVALTGTLSSAAEVVGLPTGEEAAEYLAARERLAPLPVFYGQELRGRLSTLRGCEVELVGNVAGMAGSGEGQDDEARVLMLELLDGAAVPLAANGDVDELRLGEAVCVIAMVPSSAGAVSDLTVSAWVREWDLPEDQRPQRPGVPDTADLEERPREARAGRASPRRSGFQPDIPSASTPPTQPSKKPRPPVAVAQPKRTSAIDVWKRWVLQQNAALTDEQATSIVKWVLHYSKEFGVNHRLIFSVIKWESDFHPGSRSHAGAIGLMQLMPGTARWLGVDPWNVQQNIKGGVQYLAEQLAEYRGRSNYEQCLLALAAYNAGPNAVKRAGGVPNIAETQRYVKKVANTFYELSKANFP